MEKIGYKMQRVLELSYDQLVIGNDLDALSFCYYNKIHNISSRICKPFQYDIDSDWLLKKDLWSKYAFNLSYNGLMPFGDKIENIRLEDSYLKAVTKNGLLLKIKYNKLYISDDYKVDGLPFEHYYTSDKLLLHDYFKVLSGTNHEYDILESNDSLITKLYFYKSDRQSNHFICKDCVGVSLIESTDLSHEDYSQGIARIKALKMMKDAGIKGRANGKIHINRPVAIEHIKREFFSIGKTIYTNLENNMQMLNWDWKEYKDDAIRSFN